MKKIIVILTFLISGLAFAQTTVTLEDQCNCEVLSGTTVTTPGMVTPAGADTGDIYVNTNTGTIYFWDGDSWELTSSDDQQLQNFTFDSLTNLLSLEIENGNTVTVDLSSLDQTAADVSYDNTTSGLTATDVQAAIDEINAAAGTVALTDNLDGTYTFTDAAGGTVLITDTSLSTMSAPVNGVYTYTDEAGNIQTIDTNASSNPYDNTTSGLSATDVQAAIDEINAVAGSISLLDNGDGTYDFIDAVGNITLIADTSLSTLVDNGDGTYEYTDEEGNTQTIDTNASSNPYDNTTSGLTATDVQAAIDEINAAAGAVALVDNGDGTYDFTDAGGNTTTITDTSLSTMSAPVNGVYTYTDEAGNTQTIDTNASSNPYDNTTSGLTATDVQAAIDEINAAAGTVALVDNGDGTYDFTDAGGNTTTITDTSLSTMSAPVNGVYTYTDEAGNTQTIDTNASSNPYDNTTSGLTATDVQAAIDEINAAAGTVALVDNGDGTYDFTDAGGNTTTITDTSLSTMSAPVNGVYTYTDEAGNTQTIDTNASSNPYDNTTSGLTATDVQAAIDEINAAAGTVALVDNGDGTYDFTDAGGNTTTITDTSLSTMSAPVNGVYTYTDEAGNTQTIDTNASSNPYDNTTSGLTATDVQAAIDEINAAAGTVALVDNGDGTYDFTDAGGNTTTITDTSLSTMSAPVNGVYTYTDEAGNTQTIDTNASSNPYDNTTSGLTATDVQAAIDEINAAAGAVALVDNGDGTYDFTDAGGNTTTITDTSLSTMSAPVNGVYTYTDEAGNTQTIDTNASSNPYDNTTSGLTATDVQAAIDEINAAAGTVALTDNLDGTYTFTDAAGGTVLITDTSLSTMSAPVNGVYTYTDEAGNVQTIDSNDPDAIVGNEVVNGTDATLTRSGTGTNADPYTLDVAADGITNAEIADDAIQLENIANGTTTGQVIQWDGTDWVLIDLGSVTVTEIDGVIGNEVVNGTDATLTRSGSGTAGDPYTLDVSADGITNAEMADNAVQLENIADGSAIGQIMQWNGTDWILVDGGGLSTDDQNIESLGVDTTTNVLTVGIEDGSSQTVDLSHLDDAGTDDQTAAEVTYDNTTSGLTATDTQAAIDELSAGSTDDQNIESLGVDTTTNVLTVGIEDGTSQTVDLSHLDDAGTDDQIASEVNITDAGGNFTATEVEGALAELAAGSTDNQNIENLALNGATNELTVGIEDGTSQTVDLSGLVGADDQDATEVNLNTAVDVDGDGNNETTVQEAIEDLAADSTDDQNIESLGVDTTTNVLTVGIEDGTSQTVDLSHLDDAGTDDQDATEVNLNTAVDVDGDGNNETTVQEAIEDLAAGSTDDQQLDDTNTTFNVGTNTLTIALEDGGTATADLSALDDADGVIGNEVVNGTDATLTRSGSGTNADPYTLDVAADGITNAEIADDAIQLENIANGTATGQVIQWDGSDWTLVDLGSVTVTEVDGVIGNEVVNGTDATLTRSGSGTAGDPYTLDVSADGITNAEMADNAVQLENIADGSAIGQIMQWNGTDWILVDGGGLSTDDQNIESLGVDTTTNVLTVGIEDGSSQTVDLSHLDDAGTDDQTAAEVTYDNTTSGLTATDTQAAIDELSAGSTDDQNIESLGVDTTTNVLTVGIEDGTSQTVDLSHLDDSGTDDQTAAEVTYDNTTSGLTATDTQAAIDELSAGSTDDQNIESLGVDTTTNVLTVGIEDGTSQTVDLSHLDDAGTDDQIASEVNITDAGGNFTATEVEGALAELAAGSTDNQNIENLALNGATNELTVGIEDGTSQTVDLSGLVGTDDQDATEVNLNTAVDVDGDGNNETTVQEAIEDLAADSTDDQNISTDGSAGNISIEDGNTITLNVNDADAVVGNEYNTGSAITAGSLEITDGGGTESVNLISGDANNDITAGTDGALYLNVASVTISETNTTLGFNGATNELTYTNELGNNPVVDLSSLVGTDDQTAAEVTYDNTTSGLTATDTQAAIDELSAGSTDNQNIESLGVDTTTNVLTVGIEDGSSQTVDLSHLDDAGTDDQTAAEVTYDNTTSGLTATDTQAAIDELSAGSTDDQNIESLGVDTTTNVLTVGIEDGTSQTVDLSHLDDAGTDDQIASEVNITDAGGNFTATEVEGALAELAAGSTDNQNIENLALNGATNVLTVGIEDGTSQTVDLSGLVGTDNQNIESLGVNATTNILTVGIEDGTGQTVDLSHLDDAGTDNQNIESLGVDATSNILTVGIEDGTSQTVDLSHLDDAGTDNQNIESLGVDATSNILTVGIEDGTSQTVDLSHLDDAGTDNQNIESLGVDATTNILTVGIEDGTSQTVDLSHLDDAGTDNQNIESLGLSGANVLTVGIEDGSSQTVDLSGLVGTDDQTAAEVSIADAGGNFTSTDVEGALTELAAGSTDNQNIESLGVNTTTNVLTVGIEDGTSQTVDLSHLDDAGTDDQTAAEVTYDNTTSGLTATDTQAAIDELSAGSTDNQNIESLGVDTTTNVLTVGIEDGTSQTVDLSHLDDAGTDDQTAAEVSIADAGGNFTSTDVEGALTELAAGSTDNQNIESLGLSGANILTVGIEDGSSQTVDLSGLVGTDNQNIESLGVDTTTNVLTVGIEDGTSQTVDLSHLDDSGTDSQTLSTDGSAGDITISGGNNITLNVDDADSIIGNEVVNATDATLTRSGAGTTLSPYTLDVAADGITNAEIADDAVQLENIADGTSDGQVMQWDGTTSSWTLVDLGSVTVTENDGVIGNEVVNATDGTLVRSGAGTTVSPYTLDVAADGITNAEIADNAVQLENIADGTSADQIMQWNGTNWVLVDGAGLSTDNQNIESLAVNTTSNVLTVGIEDGTSQTVDLSHLDDAGTDNQNIESLGLSGANVLTVGIEDGSSQTVDLSGLVGTDDQTAAEVSIADVGGNFTSTDVEGALTELAAGSTDNQNIESLAVNTTSNVLTVGIEDGTSQTVDLSHLDDAGTDDQTAAEVSIADAGGNFTSTDVEGALTELAAGSTDNQNIESLGVNTTSNVLTVGIEDGTSQTVDLSHLDDAGTDNQNIESLAVNTTSNILTVGIEDGTSQTVDLSHLDDAGTDNQNIESLGLSGTNVLTVGIEDGSSQTVDLSGLVGTDNQNIESLGVNTTTNVLTVGIEDGTSQTVDLSHLDDAGTDDQTAAEVSIADAGGNFTSTDVEGALTELAAGSTDNQNIESLGVNTTSNVLTVGIEDGTSQTVDLSHLDDAGTDNQNIESLAVNTTSNVLTVGIEDGTSQTVDLSHLDDAGTDDQIANEVNITDAGGNFTATEVEGALAELATGSTDNQNIESLGVDTTTNLLTVGIEDGTSQTVDLSHLDDAGTDNQNIESLGLSGANVLTVGIEDGSSQTVNLSSLVGTDDQTAAEVSIADAGGNFTSTDVEGALTELAAGSTDNQNIESLAVNTTSNVLTVGIEDGTSQTVDLSHLDDAGTDNQNIESLGLSGANVLTVGIEDGSSQTVNLSSLVGTDDQTAAEVSIADASGNFTSTDVEGALTELAAGSTDNQNIESLAVNTTSNVLTVGIEDGSSQTVDLSHLDDAGTDNQNIESLGVNTTTNVLTVGIEDGGSDTVDLSHLDDSGTDNQNIESLGLSGANVLTVGIEDGSSQTVNLSSLVGTDDQTAAEVSIADAGGNFTSTDVEGALTELAAGSTDNQNIESLAVNTTSNVLTVGIEDGTSQTVDLSHLDDAGTDNQNIESLGLSGANVLTVGIEDGSSQTVNLSSLVGTDNQNIESLAVNTTTNVLTVGIEDGASDTVDLSHLDDSGTDNQNIESLGLSGANVLTVGIEDGSSQTVNLSSLVGTDNQNIESLAVNTTTNVLTVGIEDGSSDTVDLSHLDNSGTDNQNIENLGLSGTTLTVGIEDGTDQTVNLSSLVGTDNQNIESLAVNTTTNVLTVGIEDGSSDTVDLSHLDNSGTDNQNIESLAVNTSTNVLTVGIEDGTSQTVNLSHLDDAGTDNQNIESLAVNTTTNILTVGIEDGSSDTVDLSHLDDSGTDDQLDSEVDLATDIDVDEGGVASPTLETTVQEVIQAIAPITSKAARIFYPPSITVDASTTGIKNIDLYQEYLDQFGSPTVGSAGAPAAVPTYGRTELYYYVTYADPTVFETDTGDPNFMTIDANGNLTIEVENIPTDYNTLINVVFVVK